MGFFCKGDNQAKERQREWISPRVLQQQGQGPNPGFETLCCSLHPSRAAPSSGVQCGEQKQAARLPALGRGKYQAWEERRMCLLLLKRELRTDRHRLPRCSPHSHRRSSGPAPTWHHYKVRLCSPQKGAMPTLEAAPLQWEQSPYIQ